MTYKVNGPWGFDGKGQVLDRTDTLLKFQLDMPEYKLPWPYEGKIPKSNTILELTYLKEGAGNQAKVTVDGKEYIDSNVNIKSDNSENRRTLTPSITIPGLKLQKFSVAPDGDDEIDMDITIDGKEHDFNLERT